MSGGGGSETTRTEPWSYQAPYLRDVFGQAQQQYYGGGPAYFPESTVVPFSDQTQQALQMREQFAQGSPYQQAMGDYITGQFQQPQVNLGGAVGGANQLVGGVGAGQQMLGAAGGNPFLDPGAAQQFAAGGTGPYAQALQGMTGFGGLGEASQFAGQPQDPGSLAAANQFVQQTLGQGPSDFMGLQADVLGGLPQISPQQLGQQAQITPGQIGQYGGIDPSAAGQLAQTAQGDFLGSNPYLDQVFDTAAGRVTERFQEDILPGVAGQFGAAGRTGSGAQALATGRAAGDAAQEIAGLAGDIYAPAYEAERGRQLAAAGQLGGLDLQGQGLTQAGDIARGAQGMQAQQTTAQLQQAADLANQQADLQAQQLGQTGYLQGSQLAGNLYGQQMGQALGAAGLAPNIFGTGADADLARRQLASNLYLGERGLGQQAALGGIGAMTDINQLAGGMFNPAMANMISAGGQLGQLGLGGIGALGDIYGNIGQQQFRAGTLAPQLQQMELDRINQMTGVGGALEQQAANYLQDRMDRFNYYQQLPYQQLGQYSNLINQIPAGLGSVTGPSGRGSRGAGAAGGALSGAATGAYLGSVVPGLGNAAGAGIGALVGGLGGYFG